MDREVDYQNFLDEFQKIEPSKKDTQVSFVMRYLQDLGNAKQYERFQNILDNADPALFGDGAVTIALVAWWYGNHLDRTSYTKKAIHFYNEMKGDGYGEKLFDRYSNGSWKPSFGFERRMFDIKE